MGLKNRRSNRDNRGLTLSRTSFRNSEIHGIIPNKKIVGALSVFFVAFAAAFFASSILAPVQTSDATNLIYATVGYEGYYVKVGSSDVAMELLTSPTGSMTVVYNTIKAATNSPNGYKLYIGMSAYDSKGSEKSSSDKQKNSLYLDGDLSRTDGQVFAAVDGKGGATSSASLAALTDNTWGYAVDKDSDGAPTVWTTEDHSTMTSATPTSDKFAAVPTYGDLDLIQETDEANVSYDTDEEDVQDSDYTSADLYYAIRGNVAREGGAYSNTIAYTAVAKYAASDDITFDPESYTYTSATTWTDTVTIVTPIVTESEDLGTASVTFSGGPDSITASCTSPTLSTINDYLAVTCVLPEAVAGTYDVTVVIDDYGQVYVDTYEYIEGESRTLADITYMQEMTSAICDNSENDDSATLTDSRDNNTYTVKKLLDGHCWMTENLRLVGPRTLTSSDSDVSGYFTLTASNSGTWCTESSAECYNQSLILDSGDASYGTYYNWYSATAGTGVYGTSSSADSSVCPKGWHLPSNNEHEVLYNAYDPSIYGGTSYYYNMVTDPSGPTLVLAGRHHGSSTDYKDYRGFYWSSGWYGSIYATYMIANKTDDYIGPIFGSARIYGQSVRCLAQ